jgi:hypothetical protein
MCRKNQERRKEPGKERRAGMDYKNGAVWGYSRAIRRPFKGFSGAIRWFMDE